MKYITKYDISDLIKHPFWILGMIIMIILIAFYLLLKNIVHILSIISDFIFNQFFGWIEE